MPDSTGTTESLELVFALDQLIWPDGTTDSIRRRDEAVCEAMATGRTAEQIAERIGVRPEDIQRWSERARFVATAERRTADGVLDRR